MKDILTLDINELVSKEIREKINEFEEVIKDQNATIRKKSAEISALEKQIVSDRRDIYVSEALRSAYSDIASTKDSEGRTTSADDHKYKFIEECMGLVYGRVPAYNGFHNGSRHIRAAVQFHKWKDELLALLESLEPSERPRFEFIPTFRMPFEWSADMIEKWASNPPYSTNGSMFDMLYWAGGPDNAPFNLVMASPHFADGKVFASAMKAILGGKGESDALFRLPEFNSHLNPEQIKEMSVVAIKVLPKRTVNSAVHGFISKNMALLKDAQVSKLMEYSHHENQFRNYFWLNFPEKWQWKYLLERVGNFKHISAALSDSSCRWTMEQKEALWAEFFHRKALGSSVQEENT